MSNIVFFGNEKLATGITDVQPVILEAVKTAGFTIEQHITGPLTDLKPHQSQLAVLAAYGHLIPQRVIDEFPLGIINVHPSLLPRYRGSTPIESAILDGVEKTGVSIMQLTAGMDEGPVYKQKSIKLTGSESKQELTGKLQELGASLISEVLPEIASGKLRPRSQPHPDRDTSYTKRISKSDGEIDWTKPAELLEREIRAYAGWPKSHTTLGGVQVIIHQAYIVPSNGAYSTPGDIELSLLAEGILAVETGAGTLCIQRLQPAGKKEMSAREFIVGYGKRLER